ncbi:MAG: TrkA family potassium uptake protein [bacterium]|nr:TrkA family potassium uptake protein [bacterium]
MKRQFAVIGLGQFGMSVAKTLATEGGDIIAIDISEEKVKEASEFVSHAVAIDATDEKALRMIGISEVDVAIISVGQDIQASILIVLVLREMGIKMIVAKAVNELHGKALEKIGVSKTIYPEIDMGVRVARSLISSKVLEQIEVSSKHSIVEVLAPLNFTGKTLKEIDARRKYGINIIAIKRQYLNVNDEGSILHKDTFDIAPDADDSIAKDDILLVFGSNEGIIKLRSLK